MGVTESGYIVFLVSGDNSSIKADSSVACGSHWWQLIEGEQANGQQAETQGTCTITLVPEGEGNGGCSGLELGNERKS